MKYKLQFRLQSGQIPSVSIADGSCPRKRVAFPGYRRVAFRAIDGSLSRPLDGSLPKPLDGSLPKPLDGSRFKL
jgi:hypothetical protein